TTGRIHRILSCQLCCKVTQIWRSHVIRSKFPALGMSLNENVRCCGGTSDDEFDQREAGMFSAPVGAHMEYHFLPEPAPKGNWTVACFASAADAKPIQR
ncbi:MAG: hypothetical protein O7E52_25310, partial [Candidatus Poribacteria bacterium]|nr:hypothetical protein [Candidatus Poribacteria bacterium]